MLQYIVFWDMFKSLLLVSVLLFCRLDQDVKVATWSVGAPDTDKYESLSFWIKDNHRAYVRYAHGKSEEDSELQWMGPDATTGRPGFRVSAPKSGACCWVITPDSAGLLVINRNSRHTKTFHWENPNPSGDTTNACPICAKSESQAQAWLRRYFLH
jgi:hypothetical protein